MVSCRRQMVPQVQADMCGVMMTLSSSWNGKRDGRADKILEKHQELTKLVYHGGMGKPLPLELDRSTSTPLAEQIPKGISAAIASGVFAQGRVCRPGWSWRPVRRNPGLRHRPSDVPMLDLLQHRIIV